MVAFWALATTGVAPTSEIVRQELNATIWWKKFISSIDLINQILTSFSLADSEFGSIPSMKVIARMDLAQIAKSKVFSTDRL